ncbi:hypothetical protein AB0302_02865 [Micrococcus sp. NPDC078436]|uniref:hypothetical protein n=1 Tax=Micrococcus sp. NPDC078436 TaxID=3154960 RepID=UPI00344FF4AB
MEHASPRVVRGPARLLRGWAGASAMTLLAALFHTAASPGHGAPGPGLLLASTVLAAPLCTALAGRALSLWRTVAAVSGAQGLFHALYGLSHGGHSVAAASAEHAGHLGRATAGGAPLLAVVPGPASAGAPTDAGAAMLAAHLVAAILTVAVLRWGERAVVALAERVLETTLILWASAPVPAPARPAGRPAPRAAGPVESLLVLSTPGLRGPPFALAA